MKKTNGKRILLAILILFWMAVIFFFSAQNSSESSSVSSGIVKTVISVVYPDFAELDILAQTALLKRISLFVRKAAHFSEFFILGFLSALYLKTFEKPKPFLKAVLAFVFCALYAMSDELHQYFVPGRACRAFDVLIDSGGALLAIIIILIFSRTGGSKKMRKKELLQQNQSLFEMLQKNQLEMNELKSRLEESDKQIEGLRVALDEAKRETETEEPIEEMAGNQVKDTDLKPEVEYGAKIIGEIVVCAATHSNKLAVGGDEAHRELVNLILGKTEVAKSEILSIVSSEDGLEVKCARIDTVLAEAKEYFESVMAQI